jgi:hypothetical protein
MEVIHCQYLCWCIHVRIDVSLGIRKGHAFPVELRRIELNMSVPFMRKLKQSNLINRSGDNRELSVCVLRFFHSRFNSTSVLWGHIMGDSKFPCLFFCFQAWHKLELCRTRRPVLGTFQPFGMSCHVCVFIIGCISVQSEMAYTQLLEQSIDRYRSSQRVCDCW